MMRPTPSLVRTHIRLQGRLFQSANPGCGATGRAEHCPTCKARRIVYDLPSTGIVGCASCGTEFRVGRGS